MPDEQKPGHSRGRHRQPAARWSGSATPSAGRNAHQPGHPRPAPAPGRRRVRRGARGSSASTSRAGRCCPTSPAPPSHRRIPDWALTDEALVSVADLLRDYHRAVQHFDPTAHVWPPSPPRRSPASSSATTTRTWTTSSSATGGPWRSSTSTWPAPAAGSGTSPAPRDCGRRCGRTATSTIPARPGARPAPAVRRQLRTGRRPTARLVDAVLAEPRLVLRHRRRRRCERPRRLLRLLGERCHGASAQHAPVVSRQRRRPATSPPPGDVTSPPVGAQRPW